MLPEALRYFFFFSEGPWIKSPNKMDRYHASYPSDSIMENRSLEILVRQDGVGFDRGQFDPQNPDSHNDMDQDGRQGIRKGNQSLLTKHSPRLDPFR